MNLTLPSPHVLRTLVLLAGSALAVLVTGRSPQAAIDRALNGAIDIHAHGDPDSYGPRRVDGLDLAKMARDGGMRGFVFKQHYESSAGLAYLIRKEVPGVEVFGAIALNRSVGGINLSAVQHMAETKGGWGRVVFMPTLDSEYTIRRSQQSNRPFTAVSRNGELLPEVKEIIAFMAKVRTRDSSGALALATGHSSPEESLMLIREARRQGVQVVVTHPSLELIGMTIAQMQEAAGLGAFLEFVTAFSQGPQAEVQTRAAAAAIRKIGVNSCIISSDLGREGSPLHLDGLAGAAKALRGQGFSEQDLEHMFKENPRRLLSL